MSRKEYKKMLDRISNEADSIATIELMKYIRDQNPMPNDSINNNDIIIDSVKFK